MQRLYFILFILFLVFGHTQAQKTDKFTVFYAKDSSSIIKLYNDYKTVFVFSYKEMEAKTQLPLELSIDKASITIMTKTEQIADRKIVFGELPAKIFDINVQGHLEFGKAMLNELDSVAPDSIITIATKVVLDGNDVTGPLYLDFTNWPGIYGDYWNQVEYYWLLDRQFAIQDSIKRFTANQDRAKALMDASTKFVEATKTQIEAGDKELSKKYSQFSTTVESLKKINVSMDNIFDITKSGRKLTEEERKKIAFLTADSHKIKSELKKDSEGKAVLKIFEKISKAMSEQKTAKEQYKNSAALLDAQVKKVTDAEAEADRIKKRLKELKRILKL